MYDAQPLGPIGHLDGRANVFKEAGWEDGMTDPVTPGFRTEPAVLVPPRMSPSLFHRWSCCMTCCLLKWSFLA
jgi:hypothetical protein